MITGSCHCQTVKFEITAEIEEFQHCHCHTCRKINGTAHGSSATTARSGFRVVSGEGAVTEYESSPGKKRCFCSRCGSHVYAYYDDGPDMVVLRIGTLDGDPGVRPIRHIWVSDKAPWYEIHDDLPRMDTEPA